MKFVHCDGGRAASGFVGHANDCVTRSISIVTQIPYLAVYEALNKLAKNERTGKRKRKISSARNGVFHDTYHKYLESLGYKWVPCCGIGTGISVHLRESELPNGRLIVRVSKHLTAVINKVIYDTFDCSRNGNRAVYGYFIR